MIFFIHLSLQENLTRALQEFKRDKINKQNARLSLVNSVYENPTMPQRKIMLSVGSTNYRPPLERSKSAPRLMVIEETGEEFDDEDDGTTTEDLPRRTCCTMDPLYPAMTLGRRRCKRGHSIRRTTQRHVRKVAERVKFDEAIVTIPDQVVVQPDESSVGHLRIGSDSGDDLDKLLLHKDYDSASPLADELMSYFDMKFNTKTTVSMEDLQLDDDDQCYPAVRSSMSLDNLDNYSDEGEDDAANDLFFNQDHILSTLIRNSNRKSSITLQVNGDENDADDGELQADHRQSSGVSKARSTLMGSDSDEGSISSGFETASTVTTNLDIILIKSDDAERNHSSLECSSVRTTPLAPVKAVKAKRNSNPPSSDPESSDSDESELSDESGYVEYQLDSLSTTKVHHPIHHEIPIGQQR